MTISTPSPGAAPAAIVIVLFQLGIIGLDNLMSWRASLSTVPTVIPPRTDWTPPSEPKTLDPALKILVGETVLPSLGSGQGGSSAGITSSYLDSASADMLLVRGKRTPATWTRPAWKVARCTPVFSAGFVFFYTQILPQDVKNRPPGETPLDPRGALSLGVLCVGILLFWH